ncbi:MAG: dTDP-4-dehydrorhamnose reductase [Ginsengibacter sp.]
MITGEFRKTILVTGANGQLGNEIKQIAGDLSSFNFLFTTKEDLPIDNIEALKTFFEKQQVYYCINCAAYTAVDKAEDHQEEAFLINAEAPANLASLCNDHKTKFIHISTDYVYDGSRRDALREEDAVAPLNVYGWSKLRGEELILNRYPSSLIIRTSWVYSSFGNNFLKTILRLFKEKDKLNVINDQYGSPTYAGDLALVIMKFIEDFEDSKEHHGIVNFCNSGTTTWYEFALAIKSFVHSSCEINPIPSSQYKTPAMRPAYSILDTSKIKRMLNLEIAYWKDSMGKCLQILQG